MPTATKRKRRRQTNTAFLVVPRRQPQPTYGHEERKAENAASIYQRQREKPCIVKVGDGSVEPLRGCEVVVLEFQQPVVLDMAELENVLNKYGLSLKTVTVIIVRPSTPIPTEKGLRMQPSPATILPASLTRSEGLQIFGNKSDLAAKDTSTLESGQVQVCATPSGPKKPPSGGPIDGGELVKFVDCIRQNLKKSGYNVYRCEDVALPNCLMIARNGRKHRLTVGILDDRPLIDIEVNDDDEHIVYYDIIMRCLSAFRGGAVA